MTFKIGVGYDIHRLRKGRKFYLGGVEIPHPAGLMGHSDGDCLIHAVVDALLGAMGEPDIGRLFPDTDPAWRDIRSTELLAQVMERLRRKKIEILNIDAVVIAQKPKLAPYVDRMKEVLSPILGVPQGCIGIKAKTNEGMGLIGRNQAVACWAVALIQKKGERR
ncbi:MAG: 2-C-methyl-D-erythritol 2,4-cyclodiphosphate synthase [Candidatus Aminicenantes bacterium]|nr:2-C-methyl-D-erythritol 2,4-cyclodiphosphate synthase [Candidatus Aminicenantes bacterium]